MKGGFHEPIVIVGTMGNCMRKIVNRISRKQRFEKIIVLLIVGLDNAGKTLVLNHLSNVTDKNVLPTMGFRTVSLKFKTYCVRIYDIGGSPQIRSLWPKYYNDVHGLIYVVDASDISRLEENRVTFGELISHENISGKPLLLLANKQDLNGAIDELDVVENLDVERAANNMRCPTRVETCSCVFDRSQSKSSTIGIHNGYKWLLDTIIKNYADLNSRVKECQNFTNERAVERQGTPSNVSIHSNPFKPIKELLKKEDSNTLCNAANGVDGSTKLKNMFKTRNKTTPLSSDLTSGIGREKNTYSVVGADNVPGKNIESVAIILNPKRLNLPEIERNSKPTRPYTAPSRTRPVDILMITNIPGQIPH